MSNGVRRHVTPRQKAEVVRRHVTGKEPVSKLAEELGVQPSQIHGWVSQVLAQAEAAFQRGHHGVRGTTGSEGHHRVRAHSVISRRWPNHR